MDIATKVVYGWHVQQSCNAHAVYVQTAANGRLDSNTSQ